MRYIYSLILFSFLFVFSPASARKKDRAKSAELADTMQVVDFDTYTENLPALDSAAWASKYGEGTFGLRFDIFAGAMWVNRDNGEYVPFDDFGYDLGFEAGWRFNHFIMVGLMLDVEFRDKLVFSPLLDAKWTFIRKPYSPYIGFHTGPYIPFTDYRKWTFSPSLGASLRGKNHQIIDLSFGVRFFNATEDNSRDLFFQAFFEF